jgi:tetratricopeptide (TPR) repeat protein
LAPKAEKELFRAVKAQDAAAMHRIGSEHPDYALAALAGAAMLYLANDNLDAAAPLLTWVFDSGKDPANEPFISKYVYARITLEVVPGASAELPLNRNTIGLVLAELHQERNDLKDAIAVVEQLEPTTLTALSLAELYAQAKRFDDVIQITEGITNQDDASALLCVFRGIAFREQGFYEAARAAFKEALRTKNRNPVMRHRALLERARCYEAEGKRAMARRDLERIMAEDADYDGLEQALAALTG